MRRGLHHMAAKDYATAIKDFNGVLLLIVPPGELEGLEAALANDVTTQAIL